MASLRRSNVLTPDGQTARFLYTILKQLDLKAIDWKEVASGLDITNGHAARMRYSRFKQQIEGAPSQPRAPRPKKCGSKEGRARGKAGKGVSEQESKDVGLRGMEDDGDVKMEDDAVCHVKEEAGVQVKQEPELSGQEKEEAATAILQIKQEPGISDSNSIVSDGSMANIKVELEAESACGGPGPAAAIAAMTLNQPLAQQRTFPAVRQGPTTAMPPPPPPHATVSLADLQLPPRPAGQLPLPAFNCVFKPEDFNCNIQGPLTTLKDGPMQQPSLEMFRPAVLKREPMNT